MNPGQSQGILGKEEILFEIGNNKLVLGCSNPADRTRGCSFDLSVGTIFWEGRVIRGDQVNPSQVIVPPGGVVGIFTAEDLALPDDVCATAFAINAMSSRGFLVLNPGHVDPGFVGPLTVKALNIRKTSIAISHGEPIFTVIFQRLDKPTQAYGGNSSRAERERKFNAETVQSSPKTIASMIELDREGPFPARAEVREMIRRDAINRATLALAFVAALAGVIAAIATLWPRPAASQNLAPSNTQMPCRSASIPTTTSGNILVDLGVCDAATRAEE